MTEVFRTVLNMSITTAYICLAIMLLRLLMKKLPKKYSYALWIIPFFRMVCPFSIQSEISLFNLIKPKNAAETIEYIPSNTIIDTGISLPNVAGGAEPVEIPLPSLQIAASANPMQIIMFAASILWLTGLGFLLIYSIFCFGEMRVMVKGSELFSDNVYVCKNIDSPFVFGVIKPKIYIPEGISEENLTYILAHEKVHIRRRDYLIKPLGFIVCAVHWFNPLVWVGFKLMERDMEQSCDEIAINGFEADVRKQYAETLLDISMRQNKLKGGQLVSFGENSVKSRIKGVISMKKPTIIITIIAVAAVAIAAVCLLTNGKEEKKIPFPENETQAMELIGVLRSDIVHDWGEPDGTLSGMWGDIWGKDDTYVTLYFEGTDLDDAVICGVYSKDKKTGEIYIIPKQAEDDDSSTTTSELNSTSAQEQIALSSADIESLSKILAENWQDKWKEISAEKDGMVKAQASVFGFKLSDGSFLAAITYPCYKNNCTVFYRISDKEIIEYGEYASGWQFELLNNGEAEFLHINTVYPANAVGTSNENGEIDDEYFKITENQLESVICVGRQIFDGEPVSWFQYDNEYNVVEIGYDEYEKIIAPYSQDSEVLSVVNLDENADYKNDEFCSFEDNTVELCSAIQSLFSAE